MDRFGSLSRIDIVREGVIKNTSLGQLELGDTVVYPFDGKKYRLGSSSEPVQWSSVVRGAPYFHDSKWYRKASSTAGVALVDSSKPFSEPASTPPHVVQDKGICVTILEFKRVSTFEGNSGMHA